MVVRHGIALVALVVFFLSVCIEQTGPRNFGGSTLDLPPGEKIVDITWKRGDIWYLTRPMRPGESPETYSFVESSNFGLLSETVTVVEHAKETTTE